MKILVIITDYTEYAREFPKALRKIADATIIRKHYTNDSEAISVFYKHSEKMKDGKLRKIVRAFEYFWGYFFVLNYVKKNHFDVVHTRWPLMPFFDKFIFKKIKKHCKKLVYTADDVIPHELSQKKINALGALYKIPDTIIVHGKFCEEELKKYYPDCAQKVFVQHHGVSPIKNENPNALLFEKHKKLKNLAKGEKIVFSFVGQISPYKGLDLLLDAWENFRENKNVFLIVAGRTIFGDAQTSEKLKAAKNYDNVYVFNERFSDEDEVLFYALSDVCVLPYRSASMSGVFFTAARYQKTILSTKVGCLAEYLDLLDKSVFTCAPNADSIFSEMKNILQNFNKESLSQKGKVFAELVQKNYNWDLITKDLVENCYAKDERSAQ